MRLWHGVTKGFKWTDLFFLFSPHDRRRKEASKQPGISKASSRRPRLDPQNASSSSLHQELFQTKDLFPPTAASTAAAPSFVGKRCKKGKKWKTTFARLSSSQKRHRYISEFRLNRLNCWAVEEVFLGKVTLSILHISVFPPPYSWSQAMLHSFEAEFKALTDLEEKLSAHLENCKALPKEKDEVASSKRIATSVTEEDPPIESRYLPRRKKYEHLLDVVYKEIQEAKTTTTAAGADAAGDGKRMVNSDGSNPTVQVRIPIYQCRIHIHNRRELRPTDTFAFLMRRFCYRVGLKRCRFTNALSFHYIPM